jgi:hypothetical protein
VTAAPGELLLFVGAGISYPSGAPTFPDLRNMFLEPILGSAPGVDADHFSPELLFDAIDDQQPGTRPGIRRAMWSACERVSPTANHFGAAGLGAAGAAVWTTNFDTLIERAARRSGIPFATIAPPEAPHRTRRPAGLVLHKPHGSFPFTGDPPIEPRSHGYDLLFGATELWRELGGAWAQALRADASGREAHLVGYRGVDLDVMPVLLAALTGARRVVWWEVDSQTRNIARLRAVLGGLPCPWEVRPFVDSRAPLHELALAADVLPSGAPSPAPGRAARPTHPSPPTPSRAARAAVIGEFRGSVAGRREYAMAVLLDPWDLKRAAAWRLLRGSAFDRPRIRRAVLAVLRAGARWTRRRWFGRFWELYATLLDAEALAPTDDRDLRLLRASPGADSADVLVRLSSKEKRIGRLEQAQVDGRRAMDVLARDGAAPGLEAMAIYNLAWIARQRWDLAARSEVTGGMPERMGMIGFNWAAWLRLDDALLAIDLGDIPGARAAYGDPFLRLARERRRHRMYVADDQQVRALLAWHEHGPDAVEMSLHEVLRLAASGDPRRPGFTEIDTLLLLADHARATGLRSPMDRRLAEVRRSSRSRLQHRRADLVACAASADACDLERLGSACATEGFGLIAEATRRVLAGVHESELPLIGLT